MIRAIVKSVVEGVIKRFSATGLPGQLFDDREYLQHYGYTSRPLEGAEAILIREGNHIVMIASDDRRYRIALEAGEVALYDDLEQKVHLTRSGIEVQSPTQIKATAPLVEVIASTKVVMTTPLLEVSGQIRAGGDVTDHAGDTGKSMAQMRATYNQHTHPHTADGITIPAPNEVM